MSLHQYHRARADLARMRDLRPPQTRRDPMGWVQNGYKVRCPDLQHATYCADGITAQMRYPHIGTMGALSNPFGRSKLALTPLIERHPVLFRRAAETPRQPRPAPPTAAPVLGAVTLVLERPGPFAHDRYSQRRSTTPRTTQRSSVRGILSTYTLGEDRRFTQIRGGLYQ